MVGPFFSLDDDVTMTRCRRRRSGRACCYCIGVWSSQVVTVTKYAAMFYQPVQKRKKLHEGCKKTFCSVVLQKDTKVLVRTYAARFPDFFPKQKENAGEKRARNCLNAITPHSSNSQQRFVRGSYYGLCCPRAAGAQDNVVPGGGGNLFNGPASKKICHFERSNQVRVSYLCAHAVVSTFSRTNSGTLIWSPFLFRGCATVV